MNSVIVFTLLFAYSCYFVVGNDNHLGWGKDAKVFEDAFYLVNKKLEKLEKSEKALKASISALITTNVQLRMQIKEITEKHAKSEAELAETIQELSIQIDQLKTADEEKSKILLSLQNAIKGNEKDVCDGTSDQAQAIEDVTRPDSEDNETSPVKRGSRQSVSAIYAFTAYLDTPIKNLPMDAAVVYNRALLNEGNAYSVSTGIFTVPLTGIYLFSWATTARKLPGEPAYDVWLGLMVNGVHQIGTVAESRSDTDDNQGSATAVLRVSRGDQVWTGHLNGYPQIHGADNERTTSFMGVLLHELE